MGFLRRLFGGSPSVEEQDQQVLAAITAAGADMSQPREIIHYLYFKTDAGTRAAVAELDRPERFVHAIIDPNDGTSSVTIKHTEVLTIDLVRGLRREFEQVATRHDGTYDGWEAAAQP